MGWSLSDIGNAVSSRAQAARNALSHGVDTVTSTASSATRGITTTVTRTASTVASTARDLGTAARDRAVDLGRAGMDLGRRGVEAARNFDVREAAATARQGISTATEAARDGITTATEWSSARVGDVSDYARSHVNGDDLASRAFRGVVTGAESMTRFQLGVAGGVTREVASTVGAVGQLAVTATEMQVSQEARTEYGTAIVNTVADAGRATGGYLESVANDPSRLASDAQGAWDATSGFVGDTASRYGQAIREGRTEEIGMDVGTVATYVVPVGGGPARGALTAAVRTGVREGGEAAARSTAAALTHGGGEAIARTTVREGGEAAVRESVEGLARQSDGTFVRNAAELATNSREIGRELALYRDGVTGGRTLAAGVNDVRQVAAVTDVPVGSIASGRGVFFVDDKIVPYLDKADATLGQSGAHFFMPLEDSNVVVDAASAYRHTGGAPGMERAYVGQGSVYGVDFPLKGMSPRVPTAHDANGFAHYLEGGHTALRLGDGGAFLVNPTREFVVPGGIPMPPGTTLFRLGEDGSRIPMRTW